MKKLICMLTVVVLCIALACPVLADEFVPSISEKSAPELLSGKVVKDGQTVAELEEDCLLITPVSKANQSDKIPDDAKNMLLSVYAGLKDGTHKIDSVSSGDMVVRDLFDVTWLCSDHPEIVEPTGVHVELTFKLGVAKGEKIEVMTYKHGKWNAIVDVVNNGDGTVTCVFEDFCPVAFLVSADAEQGPSQTGDDAMLILWISLMAVAAAGLVVLAIVGRKFVKKAN